MVKMNVLIFVVLTILHHACSNIINIYNGDDSSTHSFAEYPVWADTTEGVATLEFKFKTNSKSCVLLFVNDGVTRNGGTQRNEFQLRLNEVGGLEAEFFMGHEDELSNKHVVIGNYWNDMEWHHVRVARKFREVTVQIDDSEGMMVSFGEKDRLHLTSNVRIGGFETSSGFRGCIKGVRYPIGSQYAKTPTNRNGDVRDGCFDVCEQNQCQNDAKCLRFFDPNPTCRSCGCDCSSTSFTGKHCLKPETIGYFQKAQYITTITDSLRAARVNLIQFRFRTNLPSGLMLYHGGKTEYVLIELVNGNVELKMSLENDPIHLKIGTGQYHDGGWHSLLVKRYGSKVILKVDQKEVETEFKFAPLLSCEGVQTKFLFIGGHHSPSFIPGHIRNRHNFEGCLQQVYFKVNGLYRNEEADILRKANQPFNNRFRTEGGLIKKSCPVVSQYIAPATTTTTTTTLTTQKPATKSKVDPHVRGGELSPGRIPLGQESTSPRKKLSQDTVAWITGGICVGSIALILTLACGFYFLRKRYSGQFSAQYKAAAKARGVYQDMMPVDFQHFQQQGQPMMNQHPKRPKASVVL